jgi:ABC-type transporter Mla MlaB component
MTALQRITTEYSEAEDRLRLTGELAAGEVLTLWLTQRLLSRLVPHLTAWLEQQTGNAPLAEVRQEMAQQKASSELEPQASVRVDAQAQGVLIHSVDLKAAKVSLSLVFKDATGQEVARLQLQSKPLRQWLGIVHGQYNKAQWPTGVWPVWVEAAQVSVAPKTRSAVLH